MKKFIIKLLFSPRQRSSELGSALGLTKRSNIVRPFPTAAQPAQARRRPVGLAKTWIYAASFAAGMLLAGCDTDDEYRAAEPELYLTASTRIFALSADGGQRTVVIDTNCGEWKVTTDAAGWLSNRKEGNLLTITAGESLSTKAQTAVVTVSSIDDPSLTCEIRVMQYGTGATNLSALGTANCYMASTGASYVFDASIKGNGLGDGNSEYIDKHGLLLDEGVAAELLWEAVFDADKTRSRDVIDGEPVYRNGRIWFTTGREQGNAVIALRDFSGEIVWSWHIWATAAFDGDNIKVQKYETRPRNGITGYENITKRTFNMMDRNLGAASAMPASKTEAEVIKTYGLLYQFGRKDPFPGPGEMKKTGDAELIPFYDANGQLVTKGNFSKFLIWSQTLSNKKQDKAAIIAQLTYVVENPSMFVMSTNDKATQYGGDGNTASYNWLWAAHRYSLPWKASNKLWGSGLITESGTSNAFATKPVTKTIYDPCPYGYHMPEQDVWTNFSTTTTGYEATTEAEFNVVTADKLIIAGNADGFANPQFPAFGRRFLTTGNSENTDGSNVAFYPAVGTRFNETRIENLGLGIYYWSASPYDNTGTSNGLVIISATGSCLYGNNNMVSPVTSGLGRMSATPVRCVRGN